MRTEALLQPAVPARSTRGPCDAVSALTVYLVLLLCLPSTLKVAQLRGLGAPATLFAIGLAAWWAYWQLQRSGPTEAGRQPIRLAYFVLLTSFSLSFVVAMSRPIDSGETNAAVLGLIGLGAWGGVLLLANDGIDSPERLRTLMRRVVFVGGCISALGVAQFVTGERWVDEIWVPGLTNSQAENLIGTRSGFNRPASTALHPIEFGYVVAMILPLALNLAIVDRSRSRLRRLSPVFLMCFSVTTSISRSALIGALVGVTLAAMAWPRHVRRIALLCSPLVGVAVFVTMPGLLGTTLGLFTGIGEDTSAQSRTGSYAIAAEFVERSPVLGRGFGTFTPAYRILDNAYLLLSIEVGVLGLVSFLVLVGTGMSCAVRIRRLPGPDDRLLGQALLASLAAGVVGLALFDGLSFPMAAGTMFLMLGITGAYWRLAQVTAPVDTTDAAGPD